MIHPHVMQTLIHLYPGLQSFLPFISGAILVGFSLIGYLVWKLDAKKQS